MFIDKIYLTIQSGDGGKGCESYYHRTDKKSIPEGGDGGNGGSVIIRADHNAPPLSAFRYKQHQIAESGEHGSGTRKRGRNGKDLILTVPVGTRIYDRHKKFLIRELLRDADQVIVLQGGRGGTGNAGGKQAFPGEKGHALDIELTIRVQADIYLIGYPNSGKSALLNALTRARAKEEHYPFTTTFPQIAVYEKSNYEKLTLCEMPSIYASSHEGRGLGNAFLKHLENAKMICYVLSALSDFAASIEEQYKELKNQLEIYNPKFLEIPSFVIVTKMDLEQSQAQIHAAAFLNDLKVFPVSAKSGQGMDQLKAFLDEQIEKIVNQHDQEHGPEKL